MMLLLSFEIYLNAILFTFTKTFFFEPPTIHLVDYSMIDEIIPTYN